MTPTEVRDLIERALTGVPKNSDVAKIQSVTVSGAERLAITFTDRTRATVMVTGIHPVQNGSRP